MQDYSDLININNKEHPGIYFSKVLRTFSSKWKNKFQHLVYPIPDEKNKSLGIHLTINKDGFIRLGQMLINFETKMKIMVLMIIKKIVSMRRQKSTLKFKII